MKSGGPGMSKDLAKREAGPLALTPENAQALADRPLLALPAAVRPACFQAWSTFRYLAGFETPLVLVGPIATWINEYGLDPGDATKILNDLRAPAAMALFKFPSELMTHLAEKAREAIDRAEAERKRSTPAIDAPRLSGSAIQEALRKSGLVQVSKTPEEDEE